MRYAIIALGVLVSFGVFADPRIEVNANNSFCHVPYDPNDDDDNETFIADCGGKVIVNNGTANGYAVVRDGGDGVPQSILPIAIPEGQWSEEVRLTCAETGQTCTLVDSNNTEYTTNDCSFATVVDRASYSPDIMATAFYEVFCRNAQQAN